MAADTSVVKPLEAPPLSPLALKTKLAPAPSGPPKYPAKVKNGKGQEIVLGDPRATRALIALMDVHAVNGGAACHWGGPAAFAAIVSAIYGPIFATNGRPWYEAYNFVNDAGHTQNGIYAPPPNPGSRHLTFEAPEASPGIK